MDELLHLDIKKKFHPWDQGGTAVEVVRFSSCTDALDVESVGNTLAHRFRDTPMAWGDSSTFVCCCPGRLAEFSYFQPVRAVG